MYWFFFISSLVQHTISLYDLDSLVRSIISYCAWFHHQSRTTTVQRFIAVTSINKQSHLSYISLTLIIILSSLIILIIYSECHLVINTLHLYLYTHLLILHHWITLKLVMASIQYTFSHICLILLLQIIFSISLGHRITWYRIFHTHQKMIVHHSSKKPYHHIGLLSSLISL